jgi:hypothetical protein
MSINMNPVHCQPDETRGSSISHPSITSYQHISENTLFVVEDVFQFTLTIWTDIDLLG